MSDDEREPYDREHIAPVYDPPRLGYSPEPGFGWAFAIALAILGILFAVGADGVQGWILNVVGVVSAVALVFSTWRWWRAIHRG